MNLIAEAKDWYKMHSVWVAGAIAAVALAWFFLAPVRNFVPLGGLIASIVVLCVILVVVRLVPQDDIVKLGGDVRMVGSEVVAGLGKEFQAGKAAFDRATAQKQPDPPAVATSTTSDTGRAA